MTNFKNFILMMILVVGIASCGKKEALTVLSPDSNLKLQFELVENKPVYSVTFKGKEAILPSSLGFVLKDKDGNVTADGVAMAQAAVDAASKEIEGMLKSIKLQPGW